MNKHRPTLNRISWTTVALNFFLELQWDIDELRISKGERKQGFAEGTLEDAQKLLQNIIKQLGVVEHRVRRYMEYQKDFWFVAIQDTTGEFSDNIPESDKLEKAFNEVGDVYVKNQQMWDNAEEVKTDSDEKDTESDENGSDMKDNIPM